MFDLTHVRHRSTTDAFELTLNRERLLELLASAGVTVPSDATIVFHVPGGADWSNRALDIDADNPVHISWSRTTYE